MSERIHDLIGQIKELEEELKVALQDREKELSYRIEGSRVRFDEAIHAAHKRLKSGLITWLRNSQARNVASAPFIYAMIFPITVFDLSLSLYQAVCFRLYAIPRVKRSEFIVIDRHQLAYLNVIEKLNCIYCGYGNGVISYAREILSRTEQYWCPVKHAHRLIDAHSRYKEFAPYGDATAYPITVKDLRKALRDEPPSDTPGSS